MASDGDEYDEDEQRNDEPYDDDDELYDFEREQDQGEEDMANDEHEEQADKAAMLEMEITGLEGESELNNTLIVTKKRKVSNWIVRKGRCPTKGMKKALGPMQIQFDSLNRPRGPFRHQHAN